MMQNVNLLDARLLPHEPVLRSAVALAAFALGAAAVLGHGIGERWLTQRALAAATAASSSSAPGAETGASPGSEAGAAAPAPADQALQVQLARAEAQLAALRADSSLPAAPARTLRHVLQALPDSMWLTEIELAGARGLRIAGGTLQPQALSTFAQRLGESTTLRGLGLQTVRLEPYPMPAGTAADGPPPAPMLRFVLASSGEGAAAGEEGAGLGSGR